MTIAAITEKYSEEQLRSFFPGGKIRWQIVRAVGFVPGAEIYLDMDFVNEKSRVAALALLQPALVIVNAVVPTIREIGQPFVRINGWPGFWERSVHELVSPDEQTAAKIGEFYHGIGRDHRLVPDEPGMVSARILAAIINEAFFTWEAGVSTKEEIDTAMKLGTNYPLGPFEWTERIGAGQVVRLLGSLSRSNEAYFPSAALRQEADKLKYD